MAINNSVQKAMNHVVASRRLRMAATWIAEAQKIVRVHVHKPPGAMFLSQSRRALHFGRRILLRLKGNTG